MWQSFNQKLNINSQIHKELVTDTDFLANPGICFKSDVQAPDVLLFIDTWLSCQYGQNYMMGKPSDSISRANYDISHNEVLETLAPFLEPHITEFINLIKQNANQQTLNRCFRAMTVYAGQLYEVYEKNQQSILNSTILIHSSKELIDTFGTHNAVVTETSCPISLRNIIQFNPLKPFDYLNAFIGPYDDFYCPYCGEKIRYGSNTKTCPRCNASATCNESSI